MPIYDLCNHTALKSFFIYSFIKGFIFSDERYAACAGRFCA